MVEERDIYEAAGMMLRFHGRNALFFAAARADELHKDGDLGEQETWLRIISAIRRLSNAEAPPREMMH